MNLYQLVRIDDNSLKRLRGAGWDVKALPERGHYWSEYIPLTPDIYLVILEEISLNKIHSFIMTKLHT